MTALSITMAPVDTIVGDRRHFLIGCPMAERTLALLLDEVRGKTLFLLAGVSEAESRWRPAGLQNHILWHSGHAYVLLEWLGLGALGFEPSCSPGWFDMFRWESSPALVADNAWPAMSTIAAALAEQHGRVKSVLNQTDVGRFDAPLVHGGGQTVRYRFLHALHDEACHSGEIWLLRKLYRAREKNLDTY